MTFQEFCKLHKVSTQEAKKLLIFLHAMKTEAIFSLVMSIKNDQ